MRGMTDHRPKSYRIVEDDLTGQQVIDLLAFHLGEMHALSPACKVHAMPVERLRQPDVTFYSAWDGDTLAAPAYRGKGAGQAILHRLIDEARARGYHWLGLETGRPQAWYEARCLYEKHGFKECADFGDYVGDEFSMCMDRTL